MCSDVARESGKEFPAFRHGENVKLTPLLIDYREPQAIKTDLADIAQVLELPEGDYGIFAGESFYLVERKAVGDFLPSYSSGKLASQLRALHRRTEYGILLLEGWWQPTKDLKGVKFAGGTKGYNYLGILNFLFELQLFMGIMIIQTTSQWATIGWLRAFHDWCLKPEHKALKRVMLPQVPENIWDPEESDHLRFLMCLPGVGQETARALLDNFPTPMGLVNASAEGVESIKGIGPKTRKKIWEFLGKPEMPKVKKRMKIEEKVELLRRLLEEPLQVHPDEAHRQIEEMLGRPVWMHEMAYPELLYQELHNGQKGEAFNLSLSELAKRMPIITVNSESPKGE